MIVMDFKLSPETESILNMVSEFSRKKIEPIANKIDSDEFDPKGYSEKWVALGFSVLQYQKNMGVPIWII